VPTAFQGSKCVRGELKRRKYQVKARYLIRATALLPLFIMEWRGVLVGLYKIFFHLFVCVQESIIPLSLPPPILLYPHYCNTIARLLRDIFSPTLPLYAVHHTILGKKRRLRRCISQQFSLHATVIRRATRMSCAC